MTEHKPEILSLSHRIGLSQISVLITFVCAIFLPWAKIGVFEFKPIDLIARTGHFMNGIRWFTGHGSPQEAAATMAFLIIFPLLIIPLALVVISLILRRKSPDWAARAAFLALGLSAAVPAAFITAHILINGAVKGSQMTLFPVLALLAAGIPLILYILFTRYPESRFVKRLYREKTLWLISGAALVWLFIFAYIPMIGIATAFFNYRPGMSFLEMPFVGFRFFREFFMLPDFMMILRNTLVISGLGLTVGFVAPIVFALLLNELLQRRFKRIVQTISYMPYFVSWVVVASIMTTLLNSDGLINEVLVRLGLTASPISFLNNKNLFWWVQLAANIWKGVGWSSIIYLAAIAGVDQELYQAGAVDGLGRLGRAWHITLPGIRATVVLLFILGIGGIFNTGFEYQLLVGTPLTREVHEVVDTYVYRYGVQQGRYSFATAVGLMKSVIGFTLVIVTNFIAKKVSDISIL